MTLSPPGRHAVVIEDHDDIRDLLVRTISTRGFAVTGAATAEAGLRAARRLDPDLITLDLGLPDQDGLEVCRRLRAFSHAYLLVVTARPGEVDRLKGLELGADDYISKPFSPRELQARIEAMFRRPRARTEQAEAEDLRRAAEIQRSLLPPGPPDVPGYDVAGACRPSRSVGGDSFDWHPCEIGLQLTVADTMGKGMGAALITATARAVMRSTTREADLLRAFHQAVRCLDVDLDQSGSFITLFHARLDRSRGVLEYIDAGHGLALHLHTGQVTRLPSGGPPVGALRGADWVPGQIALAPGDAVVVVSDGLLDAYDDIDEAVRAVAAVVTAREDPQEACEAILDLTAGEPSDDVTAVVLRRRAEVPA